jgi:hypothetical protein
LPTPESGKWEVNVSAARILAGVRVSLAAAGLLVVAVLILSFFAYATAREFAAQTASTPAIGDDLSSAPVPSSTSSSSQASSPRPISNLPLLPIDINVPFRNLSGGGFVAQFHNTSDKLLRTVINGEGLDIPPHGTIEIGWDRGFRLNSGDSVTIASDGYLTGTWTVP